MNNFLNNLTPVVKNLLAINIIMWLVTLVAPGFLSRWGVNFSVVDFLGMHYWAAEKFNPAQLITYMFMHGGFNHMFFNMFALFMFGSALESVWGSRRFLLYYIVTGVGAGIVQQVFWTIEFQPFISSMNDALSANPEQAGSVLLHKLNQLNLPLTVGASGSVFGLLLAFGWLFPEARLMMIFIPVPIKARVFVLLYGVVELFLGVANFSGDNIAHFAHLGGMLFGAILILVWRKKRGIF
ncbi:MAG: rhomboid family intramembrane serine protease [Paludibacteraceae bacterium]|nr:rhomboid family intramembrane serine protease [Paludibacteraceae bacterium]